MQDYNTSYAIMEKLISLGCCQFIDDNAQIPEMQRRHRHDVVACMERDRQMRLLVAEGNRFLDNEGTEAREAGIFGDPDEHDGRVLDGNETMTLQDITERLQSLEQAVLQKNAVVEKLHLQLAKRREHRYVVEICSRYLQNADNVTPAVVPRVSQGEDGEAGEATQLASLSATQEQQNSILHLCGTCPQERAEKLRTVLFRASHGIIMTHMTPLMELLYDAVTKTRIPKAPTNPSPNP